jgi:hypothetical protein
MLIELCKEKDAPWGLLGSDNLPIIWLTADKRRGLLEEKKLDSKLKKTLNLSLKRNVIRIVSGSEDSSPEKSFSTSKESLFKEKAVELLKEKASVVIDRLEQGGFSLQFLSVIKEVEGQNKNRKGIMQFISTVVEDKTG